MNALVIEDEYYIRKDICSLIREFDEKLEIRDFETPIPALDYLQANRADIIVCDIRMPDMDGLDFLEIVSREHRECYSIIVSGFGSFAYAQQAIRFGVKAFLLKPVDQAVFFHELAKATSVVLANAAAQARETPADDRDRGIEEWLYYRLFGDPDRSGEGQTDVEAMWATGTHCLSIVKTDVPPTPATLQAVRRSMEGCRDVRPYLLRGRSAREFIVVLHQEGAPSLQGSGQRVKAGGLMKQILGDARRESNARYFIAVSDHRTGTGGLVENLRQAQELIALRFYANRDRVLDSTIYGARATRTGKVGEQKRIVLEDLLIKGCWQTAREQLDEVFREVRGRGMDCRYDVLEICSLCYDVLVKLIWRSGHLLNAEAQRARIRLGSPEDYYDADQLRGDLLFLLDSVREADAAKTDRGEMVSDLLEFVDRNYDRDICLTELAKSRYGVSLEHLSRRFKQRCGKNLSAYLKDLRIARACELLGNDSLSITDIAGMVGYNDISHFIQTFKKSQGVTPGEFRRRPAGPESGQAP
jgi:two-component system response regulator YesN